MDYKYKDLFLQNSTKKELHITYDSGEITNAELHSNQFDLTESICSENELRFGGCEASCVRFKISNIFESLVGKEIDVSMVLDNHKDNPFKFGKYKVFSDVPTADRAFKEIVAYDKMYDIINADVAEWYNSLPFPMTIRSFRNSFVSHFGLNQVDTVLVNDDVVIEKTIEVAELSGKAVAVAICEVNGCFGHINRNNEFDYIRLSGVPEIYPNNDLYPSNDLYPLGNEYAVLVKRNHYISCQYEDFKTGWIDAVEVRPEEESAGAIAGDASGNVYVLTDNFLLYGKTAEELTVIAENILSIAKIIQYRPATITAIGNPTICVGDGIRLNTKHEIVNTYVLQRTLSGIQALKDNYTAEGTKHYEKNINSVKKDVIKLKSKVNVLTRTVDETKSSIEDLDKNIRSEITQSAEELRLEIGSSTESTKKYTDDKLKTYSTTVEMESAIKLESDSIKSEVSKTYQTIDDALETEEELRTSITQNADNITSEVSRAKSAEESLSTRVTQNANGITSKVSKGSVSSEISQEADTVSIKGNRLIIESDKFTLDKDGKVFIGGYLQTERGLRLMAPYINSETDGTLTPYDVFDYSIFIKDASVTRFGVDTIIYGPYGNISIEIGKDSWENYSVHIPSNVVLSCTGGIRSSSLSVSGTKSRIATTKNYGERLLYCYETPSPMFGDIGEGQLDETGKCYVFIDDMFGETVDLGCNYQVFLQAYGKGECYVSERKPSYFVVEGTENLSFGWELKAIQKEYDTMRLEQYENEKFAESSEETLEYLNRVVDSSNENVVSETYNYLTESLYSPESEVI